MESTVSDLIQQGESYLQYVQDSSNRGLIGRKRDWKSVKKQLASNDFFLYHLQEITFERKAPRREALENVLGVFRGMKGFSYIYIILGSPDKVDFYMGVAKDFSYEDENEIDLYDIADTILEPSILGNFRGSKVEEVSNREKKLIIQRLRDAKYSGIIEGVPSIDKQTESSEIEQFQGVDRLIDIMFGSYFGFVVIAEPYTDAEIEKVEKDLICSYETLSAVANYKIQVSEGRGSNEVDGIVVSEIEQRSSSTQESESTSDSHTLVESEDERSDNSFQKQNTSGKSSTVGTSQQESANKSDNQTSGSSSNSTSSSDQRHKTIQESINNQYNCSETQSENTSKGFSETKTQQYNIANSESKTQSSSSMSGTNKTKNSNTTKSSNNMTLKEVQQGRKYATEWLQYIDKVLLPRLDNGWGKGLYLSCVYVFADNDRTALHRLGRNAVSIFSGTQGNRAQLRFNELSGEEEKAKCLDFLRCLQIPQTIQDNANDAWKATAFSRREKIDTKYCGNWMSVDELGILAGLPRKEVAGLTLNEEVEFGLNVKINCKEANKIHLGTLIQGGRELENTTICLDKKNLDKHTFVAGVTGSGKTTTCQNILLDANLPFLVVEPAKTEYRILTKHCSEILYFTLGKQNIAPFYLNPFEIFPGEAITSRVDMLKATMEASFDMEAAIPQILESAMYLAYQKKGWNIYNNTWNGKDEHDEDGPFASDVYAFPMLSDYLKAIDEVVKKQGFDERLKNDYLGSIRARLEGLMVGAKGLMLNTPRSIDFKELVTRKVVIELEEIRSSAEKSLIMGLLLTNLVEAVKAQHRENINFQHITLVEEAHRLFSKYMPGDSLNKKHGVEVFTDMLAEVRKYGECLIIADQIPEKMTPEILKNTNTKIVHKLFDKDDKEVIGNTMMLSDEQKRFLANLVPGRAIVFSQGFKKAIQVQVAQKQSTTGYEEIDEKQIREIALDYYTDVAQSGVLRGLNWYMGEITPAFVGKYIKALSYQDGISQFKRFLKYPCCDINQWLPVVQRDFHTVHSLLGEEGTAVWVYVHCFSDYNQERFDEIKKLVCLILLLSSENIKSEDNSEGSNLRDEIEMIADRLLAYTSVLL